ncbi:hypothetical protein AK51_22235 [Serratia nematodiphila DZ0503SBS1]|nr:hypothetical protein AK51_22235 [Serratia nematodiphila DZ0503SBS1]
MTEGVPQFRSYYKGVTVKAISRLTVRIELPKANREQILSLLSLRVLPESFWKTISSTNRSAPRRSPAARIKSAITASASTSPISGCATTGPPICR